MFKLNTFAPDIDTLTPGIIVDGDGFYPTINGIAGLPVPVAFMDPLAAECLGVISFRTLSGGVRTIAGTQTKLYEASLNTWTDRSRAGDYTGSNEYRWNFSPWGDYILAVNGSDEMQVSTGTDFADVGSGLPIAKYITASNNFVLLANVQSYDSGTYPNRVFWSGIGDYTDWTPALSTQCGYYDLVDTSGEITGISKLGNYIVVFKEQAIYLGTYIGAPYVWSFEKIQGFAGAVSQGSIIELDLGVLYFGSDDFYYYDGSVPKRIGLEVRNWFLNRVNRQYWSNMLGAYDPIRKLTFWYYPTNSQKYCNESLIYDHSLKAWGVQTITVEAALIHYSATMDYDSIPSYWATYDAIESSGLTYADPWWTTFSFNTAIINDSHELCSYSGTPTAVQLVTGDIGMNNQLLRSNSFRPYFYNYPTTMTVTPIVRNYMDQETPTTYSAASVSEEKADIRCTGRFTRFQLDLTGNFEITGYDVEQTPISRR